jgi:hypothetical protein
MAKAPSSSARKGKDDKPASKSRSSASEVTKEKSKSKDVGSSTIKKAAYTPKPSMSATEIPAAPVKSVLKESRPVPSFNLVQEQDFPRGAPAPSSKASKVAKDQQPQAEKGLFEVCISYLIRNSQMTDRSITGWSRQNFHFY